MNTALAEIVIRMKNLKWVRKVSLPYVRTKRALGELRYLRSGEPRRVARWKNRYAGKRCFVIGNGPSLSFADLEKLKGEITFSSNRIYRLYDDTAWRPDFYVAFEPEFVKTNVSLLAETEVRRARFLNKCGMGAVKRDKRTFWLNCTSKYMLEKETTENIEFSADVSRRVGDGYSVTYTILQLAIYMGFSEIILLGMDHNRGDGKTTHFYRDTQKDFRAPTFWDGIEYAYRLAGSEAKRRGCRIRNATRGGHLEIFERADLDELLGADAD